MLALQRQERGGSKPTAEEVARRLSNGSTPLDRMLNAEYLLAMDPEHLAYGEALLRAAVEGGYREAAKWIADLVFLANNNAAKPSADLYVDLRDAYAAIGQFDRAAAACQRAIRLKPQDKRLLDDLKQLRARLGIGDQDVQVLRPSQACRFRIASGSKTRRKRLPKRGGREANAMKRPWSRPRTSSRWRRPSPFSPMPARRPTASSTTTPSTCT